MTIPIDRDELRVGALRDGVMSDTISREAAVAVLVNEIDGDDYENDAPLTRCIDRIRALPAAPAPQPWTEEELARAITDEKAIAIARQHPETLPSLFAWRTDDEEDLSKHHFTAQDLAADLLAARAEIAALRALPSVDDGAQYGPGAPPLRPGENRIVRRLMQTLKLEPCRDHSCVQGGSPVKGMGTNGGCRCANNVESAVFDLMRASVTRCRARLDRSWGSVCHLARGHAGNHEGWQSTWSDNTEGASPDPGGDSPRPAPAATPNIRRTP